MISTKNKKRKEIHYVAMDVDGVVSMFNSTTGTFLCASIAA